MIETRNNARTASETSPSRERLAGFFELCVRKTRRNIRQLADAPEASTWSLDPDGRYWRWNEGFFDIGNWTTSFFTGMALLAWRQSRDDFFLKQVNRLAPLYRLKVYEHDRDTMHDLGFLYTLYSVALYKLTGDAAHRETGLRAAEVLARRFDRKGGYLRAWGRLDEMNTDYAGLAIIDCMMNLPLLHWAAAETGNALLRQAAVGHADTTLKYFIRPDDSVFHSFRFDPLTGRAVRGDNYCGKSVESQWARGTAWAIYGFALSYRHARDPKYLEAALKLARKFISHLDGDGVPAWDFRLGPAEPRVRDSSAAAIAVCGFQELLKHRPGDSLLSSAARRMLSRLCSEDYLDSDEACAGILKQGQVGDGIGQAKNAYTSWGDYYFMEALAGELGMGPVFW